MRALEAEIGRHAAVRWHWVRGHETGAAHAHKALNDRADRLAVAARPPRRTVLAWTAWRRSRVEIWSDVVCPWCYVGKRRFEAALAGSYDDDVDVRWR